jgi:hypothetical protein
MSAGYTPGPWAAEWMNGSICFGIRTPEGTVAYTRQTGGRDGPIRRQHEANARLIAAAPELVEALRELIAQCHDCEKELTEELHHVDFTGESLPLCNARALLARIDGETE